MAIATTKEMATATNCFLKLKKSPRLIEELKIDRSPKQLSKKAGKINRQLAERTIFLKLIKTFLEILFQLKFLRHSI